MRPPEPGGTTVKRTAGRSAGTARSPRVATECEATHDQERGAGCDQVPARRPGVSRREIAVRSARCLAQLEACVRDVVQPAPRITLEAAAQQAADRGRRFRRQRTEVDVGLEHAGEHVAHGFADEEPPAGQHLPEHHAEGPDVGSLVDGLAAGLLGRHVGRGAEDDPGSRAGVAESGGLGQIAARPAAWTAATPGLGEAEVQHLHLAVGRQLDVCGLQVAVDDAVPVRLLEGLGDLLRDRDRFVYGDRAARQTFREVLAGDELHRQEVEGGAIGERRVLESVDVGDVRVVEGREQLRLALEADEALLVLRQLGRQHLDRHVAAELRVGGAGNLAHSARAERRHDQVGSETGPGWQRQAAADPTSRGKPPHQALAHPPWRSRPSRAARRGQAGRGDARWGRRAAWRRASVRRSSLGSASHRSA